MTGPCGAGSADDLPTYNSPGQRLWDNGWAYGDSQPQYPPAIYQPNQNQNQDHPPYPGIISEVR